MSRRQGGVLFAGIALFVLLVGWPSASNSQAAVRSFEAGAYGKALGVPAGTAGSYLELQARAGEKDIVTGLEDRLQRSYAGIWFDSASGEYVVLTTSAQRAIAVGEEMAAARLAGSYRTRVVSYSWEELEAAQRELDASLR